MIPKRPCTVVCVSKNQVSPPSMNSAFPPTPLVRNASRALDSAVVSTWFSGNMPSSTQIRSSRSRSGRAKMDPEVTTLRPEATNALTRAVPESVVPVSGAHTRSLISPRRNKLQEPERLGDPPVSPWTSQMRWPMGTERSRYPVAEPASVASSVPSRLTRT